MMAGCALVAIILIREHRRDNFLMSTDPIATGIERPLWSPTFKITGYLGAGRENDYYQLKDIPDCMNPTSSTRGGCGRVIKEGPPYERSKI